VIDVRSLSSRAALLGFAVSMLLAWFCYRPAIDGTFQLDDFSNLGGLSRVSDLETTIEFTLAGKAGPLGRPIALATFAAQAESWDQDPSAFLEFNVWLHLLNAVLVAFCLFRLALSMSIERSRALTIAALAGSLWVLMPLLATASMLVVQRMTTLSATFVLLGMAGYLVARSKIEERPNSAILGMSGSLILGTSLAMLCKESGLLLPVYVLVLEFTVLDRPRSVGQKHWRIWTAMFLGVPLALILVYLASRMWYPESTVLRRDFTAAERLLSEAQILWIYLGKAILGLPERLGVFQDPPTIVRSLFQPVTFLATASWLLLATAALTWRRRYPLAALAVLWYLAGHLIESTVVPLELYFEHRNYLPIIGPLFALTSFVLLAQRRVRTFGLSALLALAVVNAYFLYVFASLWGDPSTSSRYWAMRYPESVRAVTTMATYQLVEEGPLRAIRTIDAYVSRNPQHSYLRLQELNLLCRNATKADYGRVLQQLNRNLNKVDFTYSAGTMLSQLFDASVATKCPDVDADAVVQLAATLRSNPRYIKDPTYNQFHEKLMAAISRYQGDIEGAIQHLHAAIAYRPSSELNMMMVTALAATSDFDAAKEFIDDARSNGPVNPMQALEWRRDLDGLRAYIDELEKVEQ
jgi:hypothetical protein